MVTSTLVPTARRRRCSSFGGGEGGVGGGGEGVNGCGEGQAPPMPRHAAAAASSSQLQRRESRLPEEAAGSGVAMGDGCGGPAAGVVAPEARRRAEDVSTEDVSMVTVAVASMLVAVRSLAMKSASLTVPVVTNENSTAGLKAMPGTKGGGGRKGEGGGAREALQRPELGLATGCRSGSAPAPAPARAAAARARVRPRPRVPGMGMRSRSSGLLPGLAKRQRRASCPRPCLGGTTFPGRVCPWGYGCRTRPLQTSRRRCSRRGSILHSSSARSSESSTRLPCGTREVTPPGATPAEWEAP